MCHLSDKIRFQLVKPSVEQILSRRVCRDFPQQIMAYIYQLDCDSPWCVPPSTCLTASSQSRVAMAIVKSSPYSWIHRRSFESATEMAIADRGRPGLSKPGTGGAGPPSEAYAMRSLGESTEEVDIRHPAICFFSAPAPSPSPSASSPLILAILAGTQREEPSCLPA